MEYLHTDSLEGHADEWRDRVHRVAQHDAAIFLRCSSASVSEAMLQLGYSIMMHDGEIVKINAAA
jgi:hypothetical protein